MRCYNNYTCNYFYSVDDNNHDVEYLNILSMIIITCLYNLMISIICLYS